MLRFFDTPWKLEGDLNKIGPRNRWPKSRSQRHFFNLWLTIAWLITTRHLWIQGHPSKLLWAKLRRCFKLQYYKFQCRPKDAQHVFPCHNVPFSLFWRFGIAWHAVRSFNLFFPAASYQNDTNLVVSVLLGSLECQRHYSHYQSVSFIIFTIAC